MLLLVLAPVSVVQQEVLPPHIRMAASIIRADFAQDIRVLLIRQVLTVVSAVQEALPHIRMATSMVPVVDVALNTLVLLLLR